MFKVRIIRLLTMVLAIGTLVSPSYSAAASTPLGSTFFSQTDDFRTNFFFTDITITKTIFLAQSESMTVTGLLETDPGNVRGPLVGATVTISLQKVNPANSNASVGAPITTSAITGADGRFTKSFTSPASGKYFITFGATNATAALTVKASNNERAIKSINETIGSIKNWFLGISSAVVISSIIYIFSFISKQSK